MDDPQTYRAGTAIRVYVTVPKPCLCSHEPHPDKKCPRLGCGCLYYRTKDPDDAA